MDLQIRRFDWNTEWKFGNQSGQNMENSYQIHIANLHCRPLAAGSVDDNKQQQWAEQHSNADTDSDYNSRSNHTCKIAGNKQRLLQCVKLTSNS